MDNCQLPKCYPIALNVENDEVYAPINTTMLEGFQETYDIQEYDNPSGLIPHSLIQTVDETLEETGGINVNTPGPLDQPLSVEPKPKETKNIKVINAIENSSINNKFLIICLIIILIAYLCYINISY